MEAKSLGPHQDGSISLEIAQALWEGRVAGVRCQCRTQFCDFHHLNCRPTGQAPRATASLSVIALVGG
jgi:hypothetical protein